MSEIAPLLWCPFVLCRGWGLDMLRQRGAEVNLQKSDGVTALMLAAQRCQEGHERVVDLLLHSAVQRSTCRTTSVSATVYCISLLMPTVAYPDIISYP